VDDAAAESASSGTLEDMDAALLAVALAQGAVFSTAQAARHGLSPRDLTRLVVAGEVVRVRQGAFVLASVWNSARPTEQLALRTRAVMLAREGAVAAEASALALQDLPLWGVPLDLVVLHGPVARRRTHSGLTVLPELEEPADRTDLASVKGALAVPVSRALVQLCVHRGHRAAMVPLDEALHRKKCTLSDVLTLVQSVRGGLTHKQAWHLDRMCALADPRCESVGETRTRLLLHDLGHEPRSQVALSDAEGFVARVDFLVGLVVVEFDGLMKYEGADGRGALAAEKRREDRLRAMGFVVVRLTWADLDRPERVAERMRRALTQVRRQAPEQSAS
jgi:hypothetical protein